MIEDTCPPKAAVCNNNMKDRQELNQQVLSYKVFNMSRLVQIMHRMVEKGCRRVRQFLCCSMDKLLCDRVTLCSVYDQKDQQHAEETTPAAPWSPPSTILIVNISNSTLIDCVIGNETYPPAVAEKQPLIQGTKQEMHDHNRRNYSLQGSPAPTSLPPSIQIDSSNLSCVIIGDNNYMQVEQSPPSEEEPEDDCESGR